MVYVDAMFPCRSNSKWRYNEACHLFADTVEELMNFADKLGLLKKEWYQRSAFSHFDLTANKRILAIRMGARELSHGELRRWYRRKSK